MAIELGAQDWSPEMENGNVHQSGQDRRERGIPVLAVRDVMTDRQTRKRQIHDLPFLEVSQRPVDPKAFHPHARLRARAVGKSTDQPASDGSIIRFHHDGPKDHEDVTSKKTPESVEFREGSLMVWRL